VDAQYADAAAAGGRLEAGDGTGPARGGAQVNHFCKYSSCNNDMYKIERKGGGSRQEMEQDLLEVVLR
jgi:hypothetical protein